MDKNIMMYDEMVYRGYTQKSEYDKALSTLIGISKGIVIDKVVEKAEIEELLNWISVHSYLDKYQPFSELIPVIRGIVEDGIIDESELEDLAWICSQFEPDGKYYEFTTLSIQMLHGVFHGILSDGVLTDQEIHSLDEWIKGNDFLSGTYPYDEINSLLSDVLEDGVITDTERDILRSFIGDFIDASASININAGELEELRKQYNISGICAKSPNLSIESKCFCFTGKSSRAKRSDIQEIVEKNSGLFSNNVTKETDYLIVGDEGNPCWAFSCYGRKVEKAVSMRKSGHNIVIVHENDFWGKV